MFERKNLEDKVFRLNLTLIEGDFKLDRRFYGTELKPLSIPRGRSELRKPREHFKMFFTKKCEKWVFWVQVILKVIFLAKRKSYVNRR